MALTDFWELKDNQVLQGQNILNVYHLKRIDPGALALDIAEAFAFSILTLAFRGLQAFNLSRTTIEVQNLGDPTDFVAFDSSAFPGSDAGDHYAIFNAAAIQFNRTRTDMKNGQKRWVMGNETEAINGVWDAAFQASLTNVGDNMVDKWVTAAAPLVDVCNFVILKRFCVVPGQEPCLKYRLPDTDVEIDQNHYVPIFFTVRDKVRSQVSRKRL